MTVSYGSKAMVAGAIDRAPLLRETDLHSAAFRQCRTALPGELDDLAYALLECNVEPILAEALVEQYLIKRLDSAFEASMDEAVGAPPREFM